MTGEYDGEPIPTSGPAAMNVRSNAVFHASMAVATAVGVFATVAVWSFWIRDTPIDIIHYQPQVVERLLNDGTVFVPQVDGYARPSVAVGDAVPVRGLRCVDGDEDVRVATSVWWERMDQRGPRIPVVIDGPSILNYGCETNFYANVMPDSVIGIVVSSGDETQSWRIIGDTTPTSVNGKPAPWVTETFLIVAER